MRALIWTSVATCVVTMTWIGCTKDPGGGGDGDGGPSDDDREAYEQLMSQLPAALCAYYVTCGFITSGEESECLTDLTDEVASVQCDAAVSFYAERRAAIDACLDGSQGTCETDDVNAFCPAFEGLDLEEICQEPAPNDGGTLTLEQVVVGAWHGTGPCDGHDLEFGWFLCPGGRLRGWERLDDIEYVDCGTWQVEGSLVVLSGTSTDTIIGDRSAMAPWEISYADEALSVGRCNVPLQRLEGAVDAEDCSGGTCSAGGTGDVSCTIDCDCGRCWYCESGVCRYAGEGPYGCYRGCGL